MSDTHVDELAAYLGGAALAAELRRCGRQRGWSPRVPARHWRARDGYTDASLCTIVIDAPSGNEKVVLKSVPHRPADTAGGVPADRYETAERDCPPSFRPHLVVRSMPSWPTRAGGMLLFQHLAADDVTGCVSLAGLAPERLIEACQLIIGRLLRSWNDGIRDCPRVRIGDFLRIETGSELSSAGSIRAWAHDAGLQPDTVRWIRFDTDDPTVFPNPLTLAHPTSPLADVRVDAVFGRRHGDLHLLNVLLPQMLGAQAQLDAFQIIDLDSYTSHGPLTYDPLFLLYSALARHLPATPPERWTLLLNWVARPAGVQPDGVLFDLVTTVFTTTATAVAGRGWSGDWQRQLRLSGLALAVYFTSFSTLSPKLRQWFFRLAARLGRDVLEDFGVPIAAEAPVLAVQFPAAGATQPADTPEPADPRPAGHPAPAVSVDRLVARAWHCWPADRAKAPALLEDAAKEAKRLAGNDAETGRWRLAALLDDATQILGGDDPTTLGILHGLAEWTDRSGDAVTAVKLYEQAAKRRADILGEFHPDTKCSRRCSRSTVLLDAAARQRFAAR